MEFKETHNSDNRMKVLRDPEYDEIIIGGSSTNIFFLWFNFYDYIMHRDPNSESSEDYFYDCYIIYKQGFKIIETLKYGEYTVDINSECDSSVISVTLTPEQTSKFKASVLDTYVQLKMINVEGETIYSNPTKLKVFKPLDGDTNGDSIV